MTSLARLEQVYRALPADGGWRSFGDVEADAGGHGVYAVLRELEAAGRAELRHGLGWRRGDVPEPGHADADRRVDYMLSVAEIVGRAGHMVQYVMGDAEKGVAPFAYTVGLLDRLGLELAITGALPPDVLQGLLNSAAALDPFPAARGEQVAKVMAPPYLPVLLDTDTERCDAAGYPLNIARAWHAGLGRGAAGFPVVQVVWPDSDYRYPWHDRFAYHGDLGGQPLLADPPPRH